MKTPLTFNLLLVLVLFTAGALRAAEGEIGFAERFALSTNRAQTLAELIPGSEAYFFYSCLHAQNRGDLDRVPDLLQQWSKRHGENERYREIANRQALLTYDRDHRRSLDFLRDRLGLAFNHQREQEQAPAQYPSVLDPALVGVEAFRKLALERHTDLSGFTDSGLNLMLGQPLSPEERRDLLQRLPLPDLPGVTELVIAELQERDSRGFGAFPIHTRLLRAQLDACRQALQGGDRDLAGNDAFVAAYLLRLQPSADLDLGADPAARGVFLSNVWQFAQSLPASQNALKVNALYRLLDNERRQGRYDRDHFLAYLALPRPVAYIRPEYLRRSEFNGRGASLNGDFTGLPSILMPRGGDEPLVRDFLAHFLLPAADSSAFAAWLEESYLKEVFAETKILAGAGDPASWFGLLPAARYQALKERVDIELLPQNAEACAADDDVTLAVAIKNVPLLTVKIFAIDACNYYREEGQEITTAVDLDGIVPNAERRFAYETLPPLRRHIERIPLPELKQPGLYVVELVGNGVSSRALVRKGRLRFSERVGAAGHVFTIFDEAARPLPGASLWLGGQCYTAGTNGELVVPYTTREDADAATRIVLSHGRLAALASFEHQTERYDLSLGYVLDRESLLAGETAPLLLRPALNANARPADLSLLEHPVLEIRTTDVEGIEAVQRVEEVVFKPNEDYVHRLRVPSRTTRVAFTLSGKVRNLSMNRDDELTASGSLDLNGRLATDMVGDLLLRRVNGEYLLEARGRNGEPLPSHTVRLSFRHPLFTDAVDLVLQGDDAGRIRLGPLSDIAQLMAATSFGATRAWDFSAVDTPPLSLASTLNLRVGDTLELPAAGLDATRLREAVSLLSLTVSDAPTTDLLDHAQATNGVLRITGLPAGDYRLTLRSRNRGIDVRVTAGSQLGRMLIGSARGLEATPNQPLLVLAIAPQGSNLQVRIGHRTLSTRVHVLARRTVCGGDPWTDYLTARYDTPYPRPWPLPLGSFVSGRVIGDEARYVLDRRDAERHPGNMLERPSLLLNPWSTTTTETELQQAGEGEAWTGVASPAMHGFRGELRSSGGYGHAAKPIDPSLDFLPAPARLWANLRPDADGCVAIPLADLDGRNEVIVLAADAVTQASRQASFDAPEFTPRDQRLTRGFDPAAALAERKSVEGVAAGQTFTVPDIATARVELIDTLGKAFRLFQSLGADATLAEFAFVLEWPELKPERRRELYSQYACHELNFFLYHKDRAFFDQVIKPHLASKRDKQFMDLWLLGGDLAPYTTPGEQQRLNTLERILLGRRLPERRADIARQLADRCDLLPPNPADFERRFQTAMRSGGLEEAGLAENAKNRAVDALKKAEKTAAAAPAAQAPAPPKPQAAPRAERLLRDAKSDEGRAAAKAKSVGEMKDAEAPQALAEVAEADKAADGEYRRRAAPQLYRAPEQTREWVESHYYHLPLAQQEAARVPVNAFWRDYAAADDAAPFLSGHVAEAAGNFTERLCALALLDLPFQAAVPKDVAEGARWSVTAASPMIIFHQQIVGATTDNGERPLMVVENLYDVNDRYRLVGNERLDKFVRDEWVAGRVYGAQVVLTNPTSARRRLTLLVQVPEGALPLAKGLPTRSVPLSIDPYTTLTYDYFFYFPAARATPFAHYPASVAEGGTMVGRAAPLPCNVVAKATRVDPTSWAYISQHGSADEVLAFLEQENAHAQAVDLERIAWRLRDRAFFDPALAALERRGLYHRTLWSYALLHDDLPRLRQFLGNPSEPFGRQCGAYLKSPLLVIDAEQLRIYEHKEYWPLVNARAHPLGKTRVIVNRGLAEQYGQFLDGLAYQPALGSRERLELVAYLLLQDRIAEALAHFAQVRPGELDTRLSYDYAQAYLAFSRSRPDEARAIAKRYSDYAVPRWRDRFRNILAQADEIEGAAAQVQDPNQRDQVQDALAARAPGLALRLEGDKLEIRSLNLAACTLRLYPMDIELLFSRSPFMGGAQVPGRFTFVQPAYEGPVTLGTGEITKRLELPSAFQARNVIVEVAAAGEVARASYTPNAMQVQIIGNYGQVRVRRADTGKPVAGAYVKVYARGADGSARFHKDGYTDLRGVFDYASISTPGLNDVQDFALLVLDEKLGAVIRQTAPPPR